VALESRGLRSEEMTRRRPSSLRAFVTLAYSIVDQYWRARSNPAPARHQCHWIGDAWRSNALARENARAVPVSRPQRRISSSTGEAWCGRSAASVSIRRSGGKGFRILSQPRRAPPSSRSRWCSPECEPFSRRTKILWFSKQQDIVPSSVPGLGARAGPYARPKTDVRVCRSKQQELVTREQRSFLARPGEVVAIQVHDFVPRGHKVRAENHV
jgi:hypothetical protein